MTTPSDFKGAKFAASPKHNFVKARHDTATPMWRRDDGSLRSLNAIIAQGARPIRSVDELKNGEAVQRLADFLHDEDHGETLTHHENVCNRLEGDCGRRESYERTARGALRAAVGES